MPRCLRYMGGLSTITRVENFVVAQNWITKIDADRLVELGRLLSLSNWSCKLRRNPGQVINFDRCNSFRELRDFVLVGSKIVDLLSLYIKLNFEFVFFHTF